MGTRKGSRQIFNSEQGHMRMASRTETAWRPASALAGLEIGDTHARWCVLGRHRRQWQVQQLQSRPLKPGWVEAGRILDYQSLVDALQHWLAESGIERLAMALPAEGCVSAVVDAPPRLLPWQRRRWLARCAADLLGRSASELTWSAHALPGPLPRWRLMTVPLEWVQDWLGLAEAVGCELVALDEAHQAAWRALDQWQSEPPAGSWLLQVGTGTVQALHADGGHWQWAWRDTTDPPAWLRRCIEAVGRAPVFCIGRGDQAEALQQALLSAGLQPQRPLPSQALHWAPGLAAIDEADCLWTVLGLASRRVRS
jgi:hypothetical protein